MAQYVIGLDVGTQSTRVIIFDKHGAPVSTGVRKHLPHMINRPGWAEHPDGDVWNAFVGACHDALDAFTGDISEIKAFGLSTQRCARAYVDENAELLHPLMSWLDIRTLDYHQPLPEYENTYKLLTNSGWYCAKLTGEFKDTTANLTGITFPYSEVTHTWVTDEEEFKKHNLRRDQLPDLVAPGEVMGYITAKAAAETGLPEGLPVVASAGDKQAEVLGAGAVDDGQAYITCGTYCGLQLVGSEYLEDPSLGCYTAANPGKYHYEGYGVRRGFWTVSWFARNFGAVVSGMMAELGLSCEAALDRLAEKVPMGCEGLMLIPDFVPPSADKPYRRGSFLGFDGRHTVAHMYRAVLEGIVMSLKLNIDWMLNDIHKDIQEIRIGGGGSNSTICMQIFADVFNRPVIRTTTSESCALGAAIDAAVGCGMYADFDEAVDGMVHIRDRFEPIPENVAFYAEFLDKVYSKAREATDSLYIASMNFWNERDKG